MLHTVSHLNGIAILYDVDSKQLVVTIEDAASANLDTLITIQEFQQEYETEIHLIGQYLAANEDWSQIATDDLNWLFCCDPVSDHLKELIKEELNRRYRNELGYVYFLQADNGLIKIGQAKKLDKRIKQLVVSLPYNLELVMAIKSEQYTKLEAHLHNLYAEQRVNGEWFDLTKEDLAYIEERYGTDPWAEHEDLFYEEEPS